MCIKHNSTNSYKLFVRMCEICIQAIQNAYSYLKYMCFAHVIRVCMLDMHFTSHFNILHTFHK